MALPLAINERKTLVSSLLLPVTYVSQEQVPLDTDKPRGVVFGT